ncbi:MAG: hypothetical protein JJD93_02570 [Ilumatobacteraceae bacterium]|nr:hypothetical protein [Ilumatobacteraceae bacterium]
MHAGDMDLDAFIELETRVWDAAWCSLWSQRDGRWANVFSQDSPAKLPE